MYVCGCFEKRFVEIFVFIFIIIIFIWLSHAFVVIVSRTESAVDCRAPYTKRILRFSALSVPFTRMHTRLSMTRILLIPDLSYRRKFQPPPPRHRRRPFFFYWFAFRLFLSRSVFIFVSAPYTRYSVRPSDVYPPPTGKVLRGVGRAAKRIEKLVSRRPRFRVWRECLANKYARKIRTDIARILLQPIIRTPFSPKSRCMLLFTYRYKATVEKQHKRRAPERGVIFQKNPKTYSIHTVSV